MSTRLQRIKYKAVRFALELAIIAALSLAISFFVSGPAHAADSWVGKDKGEHVLVGALIGGTALQVTGDQRIALTVSAAAAVGKELIDAHRPKHVASPRDAVATMVGAYVATQAPGLVITPISVSWGMRW